MAKIFLVFLFVSVASYSYCQDTVFVTLMGTVKTNTGEPALGTSVIVKKHNSLRAGTWCSAEGKFRFEGVRLHDTVYFTCVGLKPVYLVAARVFNYLDITMQVDTMKLLATGDGYNEVYKKTLPEQLAENNGLLERNETVKQKTYREYMAEADDRIFTRVEVWPSIRKSSFKTFYDSLQTAIKTLRKKYKKTAGGNIKIDFEISKKGLVVKDVTGSFNSKLKECVKTAFEKNILASPAIQNGRYTSTSCSFEFALHIAHRGTLIHFN